MLKKFFIVFLAFICLLSTGVINKTPIFKNYSKNYELYLGQSSSNAQIVHASEKTFLFAQEIFGESFKCEKNEFNLQDFFDSYNARLIKIERVGETVSYYAYSPKIKYRAHIFGQVVNLHVAVDKQVTVGSPLIYGSF
ncbi:MAG: hypothetical protein IJA88_04560 [Clostridia bacterium]|nr:hypothetical protein [Clostridia bacterium]